MMGPKYICVDKEDNIFIADDHNHAIRKYDPVEKTLTTILGQGNGDPNIKASRSYLSQGRKPLHF